MLYQFIKVKYDHISIIFETTKSGTQYLVNKRPYVSELASHFSKNLLQIQIHSGPKLHPIIAKEQLSTLEPDYLRNRTHCKTRD